MNFARDTEDRLWKFFIKEREPGTTNELLKSAQYYWDQQKKKNVICKNENMDETPKHMCSSMRQKYIYLLFHQRVRSGWRKISTRVKMDLQ